MKSDFFSTTLNKHSLAQGLNVTLVVLISVVASAEPIRLHPDNPRYFLFRGKPTALITSTEHCGAGLNPNLDFVTYLDTLKAAGLNLTRTRYEQIVGLKLLPRTAA